jgi:hypothetical protein
VPKVWQTHRTDRSCTLGNEVADGESDEPRRDSGYLTGHLNAGQADQPNDERGKGETAQASGSDLATGKKPSVHLDLLVGAEDVPRMGRTLGTDVLHPHGRANLKALPASGGIENVDAAARA